MTHNQSLAGLGARILQKLEERKGLLDSDYVVVQGDTTSAFMGFYWAFCNRIRVAHIEAGLRTYDFSNFFLIKEIGN